MGANGSTGGRVRFGLRWRITLPFVVVTLGLVVVVGAVVLRGWTETAEDRFLRQLADSGQQTADAMVRAEADLLAAERLLANTAGVAEAVEAADAEALRALVLPAAVNVDLDVAAVLEGTGVSLVAVRRLPDAPAGSYETVRGEAFYRDWPFVREMLEGGQAERRTGLGQVLVGGVPQQVLFVARPLLGGREEVVGAVLVGEYLQDLAPRLARDAAANVSLYALPTGQLLASTLEPESPEALALAEADIGAALFPPEDAPPVRNLTAAGSPYREVLLPWTARQGADLLGVVGVSLLDTVPASATQALAREEILLPALGFALASLSLIVLVGLLVAWDVTGPILALARALEGGDPEETVTLVRERRADEVGLLARAMERWLQRRRGESPAAGGGWLLRDGEPTAATHTDGLRHRATVLCVAFEIPQPGEDPLVAQAAAEALQEAVASLQAALARHEGHLGAVDGVRAKAYFGIFPRPLPAPVGALQGAHAALDLLERLVALNERRRARGKASVGVKAALATGPVVVAGIGEKGPLHCLVVGSTVELAERLLTMAQRLEAGVLLAESTYSGLAGARRQFEFGRTWVVPPTAGHGEMHVYEARARRERLVEPTTEELVL